MGTGSATTEQGLRCLTSADQHVGAGTGMRRRSATAAMARKVKGSYHLPKRHDRPIAAAARPGHR